VGVNSYNSRRDGGVEGESDEQNGISGGLDTHLSYARGANTTWVRRENTSERGKDGTTGIFTRLCEELVQHVDGHIRVDSRPPRRIHLSKRV
jgi:hypothetical protein